MRAFLYLFTIPLLAQQTPETRSLEKEQAIGRLYAAEVRRQSSPLADPFVQDYVESVGRELSGELTDHSLQYQFEVISGSLWSEPFTLPGGHVFIPAGTFVHARDENEFVGMLTHAVGHAELRHGTRGSSRADAGNNASIPLVFMCGGTGSHAETRNLPLLVPAGVLGRQRTYELEADRFGLELAARAGYDASAFLRYVERTQPSDSKYSPLPARDVRIAAMRQTLAALPAAVRSVSNNYLTVQERVRAATGRAQPQRAPTLRR